MNAGKGVAGLIVPAVVLALTAVPVVRAAGHDDEALKLLDDHKLTLVRAIDAAEAASKGKAIGAHVRVEGKAGEVLVHCLVGEKCMAVPVDIKTGKAGTLSECTAKEEAEGHTGKAKDIVKLLDEDRMSLVRAIEVAEKHVKGKAVAARSKLEAGKLEVVVRTHADGKWQSLVVDPQTKTIKSGPAKREKEEKEAGEKKGRKP